MRAISQAELRSNAACRMAIVPQLHDPWPAVGPDAVSITFDPGYDGIQERLFLGCGKSDLAGEYKQAVASSNVKPVDRLALAGVSIATVHGEELDAQGTQIFRAGSNERRIGVEHTDIKRLFPTARFAFVPFEAHMPFAIEESAQPSAHKLDVIRHHPKHHIARLSCG